MSNRILNVEVRTHRVNFAERHFDTQICQAGHAMTWIGNAAGHNSSVM